MEHEKWIRGLSDDLTPTVAAKTAGLSHTTVIRQLQRGGLHSDVVIAIARAQGVSVVDSLVDTGHIQPDEVEIVGVARALRFATNSQLLAEIAERVDPDGVRDFHGGDDSNIVTPDFSAIQGMGHDDLPAVADSSPDEPEEGTDFD